MSLFIAIHTYKYGTETYLVEAKREPSLSQVIRACDIDFEPDREEYLEICEAGKVYKIK
jgi:hypothetical protein